MPAKPGKDEQVFIELFVSAYENFAWTGSKIDRLDERKDGAVEALVTRADGQTLAIEHTLIEPFVGDKRDFAIFEKAFLGIEDDRSLATPGTGITVYVPVGILGQKKPKKREATVRAIRVWIANNRLNLRDGIHKYPCDVNGSLVMITVKQDKLPGLGIVLVRRQQMANDLDKVIEKALRKKLPKLINTKADRHVLFLERDQFTFFPDLIFAEIERQRSNFPSLDKVDEIWHVETIGYDQCGILHFELPHGDKLLETMTFKNGNLVTYSRTACRT